MTTIKIPKVPHNHIGFLLEATRDYWHTYYIIQPKTLDTKLKESISEEIAHDIQKIYDRNTKKSTVKLPYYKAVVLADVMVNYGDYYNDSHLAEIYKPIILSKLV